MDYYAHRRLVQLLRLIRLAYPTQLHFGDDMTLPTMTRLAGACALALLAACTSDGAGPGSGEVTLVLKRASAGPTLSETGKGFRTYTPNAAVAAAAVDCPFDAAAVTIDEIYLQGEGGQTTLRSEPATVDLCDLGNQALLLVQDVQVPAGSYQAIRFVISGGYLQDPADGNVYATSGYDLPAALAPADGPLQMPSWGSSGLKVDFEGGPITVQGDQKVISLDINVAQSFGKPGGSQWVMSPVIKAADISFTGSVEVRVALGEGVTLPTVDGTQVTLGDFDAIATHGTTTVTQAFDPVQGVTVFFLAPHDTPYTITLGIPASLEVVSTPASHAVTIHEGEAADPVTFTVSGANLPVAGPTNASPSAVFASPARPSFNATVGVAVQFDPTGTFDPEGAWGGTWDFGDGETFAGTFGSLASHKVSHAYTAAGNYTVTWTVTDEQGATAVATTTAFVTN
jgi:PKD repeat protein